MDGHVEIPDDFPRAVASTLPGDAPKVNASLYEGRFYPVGDSPPERETRYLACIELADAYLGKCRRKADANPTLDTNEILRGYLAAAAAEHTDLTYPDLLWIFQRVAIGLGWSSDALDKVQQPQGCRRGATVRRNDTVLRPPESARRVNSIVDDILKGSVKDRQVKSSE